MAAQLDVFTNAIVITCLVGLVTVYTKGSLQEQYIGCYHNASSQSTWTNGIMNSDALSIELCIETCAQGSRTFAILQTGRHCLCGDVLNVNSPINSCDTRCSGNGSEVCGGSSGAASAYVVYSVCPAGFYGSECNQTCHCKQQIPCNILSGICPNGCENNWTQANCNNETSESLSGRSIGCYKDALDRALEVNYGQLPSICTIELCSSICASNNHKYTAVEATNYCFCGENYTKHGQLNSSRCNLPCDGDSSEICGGNWALSVYNTCPVGYFGNGCMSRCNCKNEERCACATCICSSGCKPGWIGSRCNVRNCLENNGGCSINETCVTVDLKFSSLRRCECAPGYQKLRLWETCTDGCEKGICDRTTTNCTKTVDGFICVCSIGFTRLNATHCEERSFDAFSKSPSMVYDQQVVIGAIVGTVVGTAIITVIVVKVVIFCRRRRRQKRKKSEDSAEHRHKEEADAKVENPISPFTYETLNRTSSEYDSAYTELTGNENPPKVKKSNEEFDTGIREQLPTDEPGKNIYEIYENLG